MGCGSKKTLRAAEQSRPDVAERRDEWTQRRLPRMCQEPHRLIFLDETGTTTNMTRLRGRAPCGERLKMAAPFGHWHTQTFVAGLRCDGLVAPWVLDGPMNGEAFETYIETQLAPILARGDVVIMDNLSSHKTERVGPAHPTARGLAAVPTALQPGPQSDRDGLRQAQGTAAQAQRKDHRPAMACHRRHLLSLHARRVLELLPTLRLRQCVNMSVRYARAAGADRLVASARLRAG